jgi:hypothetical protein
MVLAAAPAQDRSQAALCALRSTSKLRVESMLADEVDASRFRRMLILLPHRERDTLGRLLPL